MEIKLGEHIALIDDEDYELIQPYGWRVNKVQGRHYVIAWNPYPNLVSMHRLIMDAPSDKMVDHINHDCLDNRRTNLRVCTNSINQHNKHGVKGYHYEPHRERYHARIMVDGKFHFLGRYKTEEEARSAYLLAKEQLVFGKKEDGSNGNGNGDNGE